MTGRLRRLGLGFLGLVLLAAVWELYKAVGPEAGVLLGDRTVLPRTTDRAMPHVWSMVTRLFDPAVGSRGGPPWRVVLDACLFSLRIAAAGWLIGVDQFAGYLQHDNKEETLRVYGETVIPELRDHVTARS